MKKEIKKDEYGYIPCYQNMSYGADTKMYNDLQDKMSTLYCKWYGSAYGLSSGQVATLKEAIKKGKTTFTTWKREFEDNAYKGITGHTLTEEKQKKKEFKKNYCIVAKPCIKDPDNKGECGFLWESFLYKYGEITPIDRSHKCYLTKRKAENHFKNHWNN